MWIFWPYFTYCHGLVENQNSGQSSVNVQQNPGWNHAIIIVRVTSMLINKNEMENDKTTKASEHSDQPVKK